MLHKMITILCAILSETELQMNSFRFETVVVCIESVI